MRAPSGAGKTRRQQQETKHSEQNRNIGRERKDAQNLRKDEEHECITDRRSSTPPLNLSRAKMRALFDTRAEISELFVSTRQRPE
jgi:hypothetical protein